MPLLTSEFWSHKIYYNSQRLPTHSLLLETDLTDQLPNLAMGHLEVPSFASAKGAVTCAVCPESAWLVTFLIGNVSTGVVTWSALRCGASGESGKKVAAAPLSKTAAAAAAAKTWFAKHPVDYMLHNRFPWKRSGRRSSMWPPYSLRRNLSAAACRPCDRSLRRVCPSHQLTPMTCFTVSLSSLINPRPPHFGP